MIWFSSGEYELGSALTLPSLIFAVNCGNVSARNGGLEFDQNNNEFLRVKVVDNHYDFIPNTYCSAHISNTTHPRDQMSDLASYREELMSSCVEIFG